MRDASATAFGVGFCCAFTFRRCAARPTATICDRCAVNSRVLDNLRHLQPDRDSHPWNRI